MESGHFLDMDHPPLAHGACIACFGRRYAVKVCWFGATPTGDGEIAQFRSYTLREIGGNNGNANANARKDHCIVVQSGGFPVLDNVPVAWDKITLGE